MSGLKGMKGHSPKGKKRGGKKGIVDAVDGSPGAKRQRDGGDFGVKKNKPNLKGGTSSKISSPIRKSPSRDKGG